MELKAALKMCVPIDIEVSNGKYQISIQHLSEIFEGLLVKAKSFGGKLPVREIRYVQAKKQILYQETAAEAEKENVVTCHCCQKKIKREKLREHVGGHIIRKEVEDFSCGFCGLKAGHSISLQSTSHKTKIPQSNCPDYRKFSLASARTSTQNTPCTNRPVECDICKVVYWSYYLKKRYEENHAASVCPENISDEEVNAMRKK